jgi:hypothetical protein
VKLNGTSQNQCCQSSKKLTFCCLFAAIAALLFQSCELEPNMPENVIEAQVLNNDGFQLKSYDYSISGFNLSIGNYPIARPDAYGKCRFENVGLPYNAVLSFFHSFCIYKDINLKNPRFILYEGWNNKYIRCYLTVNFPPIETNRVGYLRFISKDFFEQENPTIQQIQFINSHDSTSDICVRIPINKTSISGKLIYMVCHASDGRILSYDNFGTKDITLNAGHNEPAKFIQGDIETDPAESQVTVNLSYPVQTYGYTYFYLHFHGYNKNSNIIVGVHNFIDNITQIVPTALNSPFDIEVKSTFVDVIHIIPYCFDRTKMIHLPPGSSGNITHKKLTILTPQNNQTGVSGNTKFIVNEDGSKGIYVFCIGYHFPAVIVTTEKNFITLSDFVSREFHFIPYTEYTWCAGKLSNFNSIDEFLSEPFMLQENFNSIEFSDMKYFTTSP